MTLLHRSLTPHRCTLCLPCGHLLSTTSSTAFRAWAQSSMGMGMGMGSVPPPAARLQVLAGLGGAFPAAFHITARLQDLPGQTQVSLGWARMYLRLLPGAARARLHGARAVQVQGFRV
jgi:hypothetical protein